MRIELHGQVTVRVEGGKEPLTGARKWSLQNKIIMRSPSYITRNEGEALLEKRLDKFRVSE